MIHRKVSHELKFIDNNEKASSKHFFIPGAKNAKKSQNGKVYAITKVYKRNMLVSNASTLILLAKVGVIRKFLNEFGEIIIPNEVEKEMTEGNTFDSKILEKEIEDKHIIHDFRSFQFS